MHIKQGLKTLIQGGSFDSQVMYQLCQSLTSANVAQQAGIFTLLSARRETTAEILGALNFLRESACDMPYVPDLIDIVGTGGDGLNTFNISTAASLVVAACGVKVAKHGGRSVSSLSGSFDVITQLNIPQFSDPEQVIEQINRSNFAFVSAPLFNPVFKTFSNLRKDLGVPTLLNILGPIANPFKPQGQVIGVYRKDLVEKVATVLLQMGTKHALIVHGMDGLDELSLSASSLIAEVKAGKIKTYEITPEEVGLKGARLEEVVGGTPAENAKIILAIFSGKEQGAKRDIVLLNAAAGLVVGGKVDSLKEGVMVARKAIETGEVNHAFHVHFPK